jgi:hypothetical protein
MFIINSPDDQQKMVDQYIGTVKKENVSEQNGIQVIKDPYNGTVFLKQHKGYIIGIMNTDNSEVAANYILKITDKM